MVADFTPGAAKYVLDRNPNYWQPGLPKAECIELSAITESVPRIAALLSGAADIATSVDPATAVTVKDSPTVKVVPSPGGTALSFSMFTDAKPFDDVRIRQALKLVVDRQAMINTALLGFGVPANDNPVPPTSPDAYRSDPIPRDVAKAKQLLADAGYPDGLKIDLYIGDTYPGTMAMGQVYKQMAAEAGIDINLVVSPAADYWDAVWLKKPFAASNWGARPTSSALAVAYRKNAPWNESHWFRDDYDALLDEAAKTADADKRREILQKAQQLLSEEGGVIMPMFLTVLAVVREGCTGYTPPANHNRPLFHDVSCQ
jgi:peptide/nickel transport system substrate-binding protein